jgi:beta-phosphoglucomutase-like phosphatase (HAD superfamily)/dTDP-glucose pyrophosphorylase
MQEFTMNKIKLIIFDLDGVLVETKELHYMALNYALSQIDEKYCISFDEHLLRYDGLSTQKKLNILTNERLLNKDLHKKILEIKQCKTFELIDNYAFAKKDNIFEELSKNYKIAIASNSIRSTIKKIINKLSISEYVDRYYSNEDIKYPKPHPEIYMQTMIDFGVSPKETLIIEDSPLGRKAAIDSGAIVMGVNNIEEVNLDNIYKFLKISKENSIMKWQQKNMNILIPMAGAGSRFEKAGYTFPKPLIEVNGKPMIQAVVENLNIDANYIFIVQKSHREKYNLDTVLNLIAPNCKIYEVDGITEGAACTTLIAKDAIDNNQPLLMANSDQFVEWNSGEFLYSMQSQNIDGGMLTFESTHPKWSYAKIDENGIVKEVAEKNPISNIATVGIYYWKNGSDYVKYAEDMINKNIRYNNEFYVCPVFNQAIQDSKKIKTFNIEKMWGLGTPEDLQYFTRNYI